ncbi:MAG: NADPH-dependent glutamate synthase [Elusimicrobium sp.]|uniref:NADPH-dependent glutamate synthase n=1 Tax=Candidatus Avelusimicrobium gallicola TaxID=2562704 RepID=A0A928HFP6_9BACT|nr:NADPH-dependent glutamate synthase [Elusimicrobium sp.]
MPNPSAPRQNGKQLDPQVRKRNFDEVAQIFTKEEAMAEADRCLNCKNARCQANCPVGVQIPAFIALLKEGKVGEAASKIMETSLLPAICGRVCPQEKHCEGNCVLKERFGSVNIGMLERYTADTARKEGLLKAPVCGESTGKKVACIGSGPSSIAAAAELARAGHEVTVIEALHAFGGVLRYGIPSFRLPREVIDHEIETVKAMGVKFVTDVLVGATETIADMLKEYDAIYVGSGAGLPTLTGIPGENAVGVYSANEFLTRVNLMQAYKFPETDTPIHIGKRVAVLGGGNSAMDAARCAMRLGPDSVTVAYRRSEAEMPARVAEVEHAKEEGVAFEFLVTPKEVVVDENGHVAGLKCTRNELGAPDEKGRRRPVEIPGSEFVLPVDTIIVAIGQKPNPIIAKTTPELKTTERGVLALDEEGKTTMPGVYAGGDIIRGGATVLLAMKDGIEAAGRINQYLKEGK